MADSSSPSLTPSAMGRVSGWLTHWGISPLAFDDTLSLINPLLTVNRLNARVVEKRTETPGASTLVLQAGNESRAMVDGRLVRVGDPVAEGMLVKSISIESVVFAANGEDLVVAVPLERLRVLGAFPSPRAKGN